MKNFFQKTANFLREHNYTIDRHYDNALAVYSPANKETPVFSCAYQGNIKIGLWRLAALGVTACTAMVCMSGGNRKKKCKKKK